MNQVEPRGLPVDEKKEDCKDTIIGPTWQKADQRPVANVKITGEPGTPPGFNSELDRTENPHYLTSWRLAVVIACLFFGCFLVAVDTSMVTVTVPAITAEFQSLSSVAWISSAYTLTMTALQPTFAGCYKLFRVKMVYLICILIFEIGSVVCSTAKTGDVFIVGRAIQGFGGAGIFQGSLCIISHVVEIRKRALYTGIITSVFGVAMSFGPVLGGSLTVRGPPDIRPSILSQTQV